VSADTPVGNQARAQTAGEGLLSSIPWRVKWFVILVFFTAVGYGYFQVLVSAYLPQIGFAPGSVGLLLGVNGMAVVFASIPLGIYADRRGKKRILFLGLLIFPFTLMVYALTSMLAALLIASVIAGLVEGAFLSTWNALIADMTTSQNRNNAFTLSFIVATSAFGVGYALPFVFPMAGSLLQLDSAKIHQYSTLLLAGVSFISPVGIGLVLRGYSEPEKTRASGAKGSLGPLWKFSGLNSMIGLGAGFIIPLIATWFFFRFAVPDTYSGPLLAVSNMTIALAAVASPLLAKKLGNVNAIVLAEGSSTVFMLAMAFAPTAAFAGGLYVVRAALMNMSSPLSDSYLMGIIPPDQRSLASAVNSLVWRLPNSITAVLGGLIMSTGNYGLPIFLATGFYVVGISGFFLVFRNVKPNQ
jgi:MFS family permease